jgi:predicted NAD/FAD-dependent oxidoreductase
VLSDAIRRSLETIQFAPCLCGLFAISGDTYLPEPGVLQRPGESISWIADNARKGISPGGRVLTVHANRDASYACWSLTDEAVLAWMLEEIKPWLRAGVEIIEARLERWDYAVPTIVYPAPYLLSRHPGPIAFAGDAFNGPRVEGAALSGLAAADALALNL